MIPELPSNYLYFLNVYFHRVAPANHGSPKGKLVHKTMIHVIMGLRRNCSLFVLLLSSRRTDLVYLVRFLFVRYPRGALHIMPSSRVDDWMSAAFEVPCSLRFPWRCVWAWSEWFGAGLEKSIRSTKWTYDIFSFFYLTGFGVEVGRYGLLVERNRLVIIAHASHSTIFVSSIRI